MTKEQRSCTWILDEIESEQEHLLSVEKLAGNIVKQEFHKGAIFGIRLVKHEIKSLLLSEDEIKEVFDKWDMKHYGYIQEYSVAGEDTIYKAIRTAQEARLE